MGKGSPTKLDTTCTSADMGLIPGSGKSHGEGNGNPLEYSCLGNPINSKAWRATVHDVARAGCNLVSTQ